MSNSEIEAIHQSDNNAIYHDEDDLITFQFKSHEISFYFTHLSRFSKFIRVNYRLPDVKNRFYHVLCDFKEKQNVTTDNIILFFKLLQDDFRISQNLTFDEYKDLLKLTEFLQIKILFNNLDQYFKSQNNDIDFQIQFILHESKSNDDITNTSFQLNNTLLSTNIVKCLQNKNFADIPISIIHRIILKSDKKLIPSNLLYDFIKKKMKPFFLLLRFLDIENLSDDRFEDLCETVSDTNGSGKLYMENLQCNIKYIMKLKNDNKDLKKVKKSLNNTKKKLISVISQQEDKIKILEHENSEKQNKIEEIEKKLINEKEKHKKYVDELISVISQQEDKIKILEHENSEKQNKIEEIEKKLINEKEKHKKYVDELISVISQQEDKIKILEHENSEKQNKIEEIEKKLINEKEKHKKYVDEESIPLCDRGDYSKVNIRKNGMNDDQKDYVIDITKKSLNMHKGHFGCAKYIKDQLENKYDGKWCVILRTKNYGASCATYYDKCYICFTIGEFCVVIFKSSLGDKSIRLYDKGDYSKVNIISNGMNDDQKDYVIDITKKSLNMHKDHFECAKYIKDQLENKYDDYWCVILRTKNYGDSDFTYYDKCYIYFTIGEFGVMIFKSSLGDKSIRLYDKGDYSKVNIISNEMNDDQKDYVIDITKKSLNMHKDHFECAKYIKDQLENKYDDYWCVILRTKNYGASYFNYYDKCYIYFKIGEFGVMIFKSSLK